MKYEIFESVIKMIEWMMYLDVNKILVDKDEEVLECYELIVLMFECMEKLVVIFCKKRMDCGVIDFDFKEVKVLVDDDGYFYDVILCECLVVEKLIEEFMLVVNEIVVEYFYWMNVLFIYCIYEDSDVEKFICFLEFIINFGYMVKGIGNDIYLCVL